MKENQATIYRAVLKHEGGYSNHPRDRGGPTNKGITQAVYDNWRGLKGWPKRSVKALTAEECEAIYDMQYWDPVRGDLLPEGLDYAVYDFAVNSGVYRASRFLQLTLNAQLKPVPRLADDGQIGLKTLGAVQQVGDMPALITALCARRMAFLRRLDTWDVFGDGWTTRVRKVNETAVKMVRP